MLSLSALGITRIDAGFPRSLNALAALMQVMEARRQRDIVDPPGDSPGPVPTGQALLALGTANQTRLAGAPVSGPPFEFAPAIDPIPNKTIAF
ncbi:hypothetical protein [Xanthomonas campestris]|uniref:hypothetical protein n=1 Tax=Xanthomonas campestris TaxID=339 RepID=UPI001E51C4F4|nr:hypothetical protein [Xanthomonas campestris]MCC4603720.1 hypothetical protein [Xanthomonas campestris pv. parthenii]